MDKFTASAKDKPSASFFETIPTGIGHEILSSGSNMGKYTWGATFVIEYKPLKKLALSIEGRQLNSEKENFLYNGKYQKERSEFIFCLDVWF